MNLLFGNTKKKEAQQKVDINAPSLSDVSGSLETRAKAIQVKVDECNAQLAQVKKQMSTAKGSTMNSLKQKALGILKRRKMYDNQLGQILNQQMNVDSVAFAQESCSETINTMAALKQANVAQKQAMKDFNIPDMDDVMDDLADMMEDMEEINDVMGRNYACDFDENELLGELNELDEEIACEQLDAGLVPSYVNPEKQPQPIPQPNEEQALKNMMDI